MPVKIIKKRKMYMALSLQVNSIKINRKYIFILQMNQGITKYNVKLGCMGGFVFKVIIHDPKVSSSSHRLHI